MVEEMKQLGQHHTLFNGIDASTQKRFNLRAHILNVAGDGIALAEAMGLASPGNAIRPCHHCTIKATQAPNGTYYIPHQPQHFTQPLPKRENLRVMLDLWREIEAIGRKKDIGTRVGIKRWSILNELPSIHQPRSYALDLMHNVLSNITPQLYALWTGSRFDSDDMRQLKTKAKLQARKDAQSASQQRAQPTSLPLQQPAAYVIPDKEWISISHSIEQSRSTIPQSLGQGGRSIANHSKGFKAMEWEAFLLHYAIPMLEHHTEFHPYLKNFLLLKEIYIVARSWKISHLQLDQLRSQCKQFVKSFELLYIQGDENRMKVCGINIHSLLHLGRSYLHT